MNITDIKLEEDSLVFYEGEDDVYFIKRELLDEVMADGTSEWINQLSEKSWATKELLQNTANIIKQEFPDNEIDWEQTNLIIKNQ